MVSRKRQRSAEPEPDPNDDGHEGTSGVVLLSLPPPSSSSSLSPPSSLQMKMKRATAKATTIVAAALWVSGATAEENLLHPGAAAFRPLQPAASAPSSAVPASFLSCRDDATYASPAGLSCSDHRPYGCQKSGIEALGYDLEATAELLANCPQSCGVPPCEADQDLDLMRDETWPQQPPQQHYQEEQQEEIIASSARRSLLSSDDGDGAVDASSRPIAAQALSSRLRGSSPVAADRPQGVTSCHAGWHPLCQDDPSYVSKTGLPCEFHSSFDCSSWTKVGYTDMEVYDLINSCPCACAVPCGYVLIVFHVMFTCILCWLMTFSNSFICSITS